MSYLSLRLLSSFLAGVLLSQTGSLTQFKTRNVLASPSTLGFDAICIFFILIVHSLFLLFDTEFPTQWIFLSGIPVFVFVGLFFSHFLLKFKNIERVILIGLTFNLLVGGLFSLWQFFFLAFNLPFPVELWFGHFRYASLFSVYALLSVEVFILAGLWFLRNDFRVFSLGQTVAKNGNAAVEKMTLFSFCAIAIGTYTVITLFGAFSFLGLILPIISRKIFFQRFDLEGEFVYGACVNGIFLMALDYLCFEMTIQGAEVPVGLIAILVGAVSLITLLWKSSYWKKWQR